MRGVVGALGLALVLAACQADPSLKATARAVVPSAKAAQPSASAAPAAPMKLARPAGTSALAGRVAMDPGYAVGLAAGQVISNDGASVLAADAHLIGNDGGGLISNDGGSIVAQGAGNVIAPVSLLEQDGGGLISNDGGGLITNDGGSLITNDGAGLQPKARRLLATEPAASDQVAAAGMALYVRSLDKHEKLPLGQGPDGKPVYVVYTNLKGEYELYLPDTLKQNVEVVAFVPGKPDTRMHLQGITPPAVANTTVDDNSSTVITYVRFGFRQFALTILGGDDAKVLAAAHITPDTFGGVEGFKAVIKELTDAVKAAGLDKLTDLDRRDRLADRITDIVLARAGLNDAMPTLEDVPPKYQSATRPSIDPTEYPGLNVVGYFHPNASTALGILTELMANRRRLVKPVLEQPGADERLMAAEVVKAAAARDGRAYHFRRPSDYDAFLAQAVVGAREADLEAITRDSTALDRDAQLPIDAGGNYWFRASFNGLLRRLGVAVFADADVHDALLGLFQEQR